MGLKRKHSFEYSPVSTSSFTASTPEAQSPTPVVHHQFGGEAMDFDHTSRIDRISAWNIGSGRLSSTDLGSRTRKRFRDNRPNEREIHENTIQKLFSAQRNFPHASPIPSHSAPPVQPVVHREQKSTLHSFWNLPAVPSSALRSQQPASTVLDIATRCEDCDAVVDFDESMKMDLDSGMSGNQFACHDCGRTICGTCAVVSNERHCLQCATRRW